MKWLHQSVENTTTLLVSWELDAATIIPLASVLGALLLHVYKSRMSGGKCLAPSICHGYGIDLHQLDV